LEGHVGSINGNGDWAFSNSGLESRFGSRGNVLVVGDGGSNVVSVEFAGVRSSGGVWVGSFGINSTVLDDVLEGLVHQTSIATHVSLGGGAINQILLREGNKVSGLEFVGSFDGTSGGERPA